MEDFNKIKLRIQEATGIPAEIITGESPEEVFSYAKNMLAYKNKLKEVTDDSLKQNKEQFEEYIQKIQGIEPIDQDLQSLLELEQTISAENGYPALCDGGSVLVNGVRFEDPRTTKEQFASFLGEVTAFNPFKAI